MSSGLLSIGASGLEAAYTALRTTGNNIANVNTPGYSRQVVQLSTQVETGTGTLYQGTGVSVDAIARVYSDFLAQQTNLAQAMSSQADTTQQMTGQIDNLMANPTAGIGSAIDNFFTQVQGLSNQPGSAATRQALLSSAGTMASQFNDIAGQLQQMTQSTDQQLTLQVKTVNDLVSQIARLNDQISIASASGGLPNALLDERAQAVATLNQSVGVTTIPQSDGALNIFLANGQPLLVGDRPTALTMGADPQNSQNIVVGTPSGAGIAALDPNATGGGAIGALLQFRASTLPDVQNEFGRIAVVLSSQFNALQSAGVDQAGNAGSPFFTTPSISTVTSSQNSDSTSVSMAASFADPTQVQATDYQVQVLGTNNIQVTRLADGTRATLTSLPATFDGMNLSFQGGTPAVGDVFTIQPVRFGAQNIGVALTQTSQIAAASPVTATTGASNAGSLAVQNLALAPLPANPDPALLDKVVLTFTTNPAQYTSVTWSGGVAGPASAPQAYTPGQTISLNGWQLTLGGTPSNGDTVTVQPGAVGTGDNRNALLMAQLQGLAVVGNSSATAHDGSTLAAGVAGMVADVGSIAASAQTEQQSRAAILSNAQSAQNAVSGVNLDEEASRLLQYQQQYQAAARIIQTATTVFNSLLQAAGGA